MKKWRVAMIANGLQTKQMGTFSSVTNAIGKMTGNQMPCKNGMTSTPIVELKQSLTGARPQVV